MKSKTQQKMVLSGCVALVLIMASAPAHAAGFTDMFNNLTNLGKAIGKFALAYGFVAGIIVGLLSCLGLKTLAKPNQEPGKAATTVIGFVVCFLLIYNSSFVESGGQTLWGTPKQATSINSSDFGL